MDPLDRMFQHLLDTVRTNFPQYLTAPFPVSELHQTILPFRHHRRALGLETNQEYETTLQRLLSGARGYLVPDDRLREELEHELASTAPRSDRFREFPDALVSISPEAIQRGGPIPAAERAPTPPPAPAAPVAPPAPAVPPSPVPSPAPRRAGTPGASGSGGHSAVQAPRGFVVETAGEKCRYCAGELPTGRRIVYCPHCGQDLTVQSCQACGAELELGWRFCTTCGRAVGNQPGG